MHCLSQTITEWTRAEESPGDVQAHAAVLARAVQTLVNILLATGSRPTWKFMAFKWNCVHNAL